MRFEGKENRKVNCKRVLLALVVSAAAWHAEADSELQVVSARQLAPGKVLVTVAYGGPGAPKASELALRLGDQRDIGAAGLAAVAEPTAPTWLLLCLDRSGSIGPRALNDLKTALAQALSAQGATQLPFKASVTAIGTRAEHLLGFTDRTAEVAGAVAQLTVETTGQTRLLDAIAGSLAELRAQGDGAKRLVIVSDGRDEGSTLSAGQVAQLAQASFPIDAIGYGAQSAKYSGSLSTIAGATGGRFVQARSAKEAGDVLQAFLKGIVTPTFAVSFEYAAAQDERVAERPVLVYTSPGQPSISRLLEASLAAPASGVPPAPTGASAPASEPGTKPGESPGFTLKLWISIKTVVNAVPLFVWLIAAALIAALAALVARMQTGGPKPPEKPPLPTIGGTVVNETPRQRPSRGPTMVGSVWPAPQPGRPTAILRGVSGQVRGEQFAVDKPVFRIGCDAENDLVLVGDDFASGAHALLRAESQGLYVEDLGSLNGSYLNGAQFKGATRSISPGDELRFGRSTFQVLPTRPSGGPAGPSGLEPAPL